MMSVRKSQNLFPEERTPKPPKVNLQLNNFTSDEDQTPVSNAKKIANEKEEARKREQLEA